MPRPINYGIIGCGMMGREHLRNIALLPDTKTAAIFEPDAEMARQAQALAPGARMAASVEDLLAVEQLDCLLIASPNFRHVEQIETIARLRPLPLLVEKPVVTDTADLPRLNDIAARYGAPIWVAMEYRYMPPVAAFLAEAEAATGEIRMLTIREHRYPFLDKVGHWNRFNRYSGGTFVEKCCHFFDLMRLILRSEPVRVFASGGQDANHKAEVYAEGRPDIIDNGFVLVDFASGARAMLELCMFADGARYQEEISAVGPAGKIEALVPGPQRFWPEHLGRPPVAQIVTSPRDPSGPVAREIPVDPTLLAVGDHNGSTFYQHRRFAELVRGERDRAEVSLDDGTTAVLMGMAAQLSIRDARAVTMDEMQAMREARSAARQHP